MTTDLHTLVGAYAIDALTSQEQEQFEQHLATCQTCRDELDEFVATAARLGGAAESTAPSQLRGRVLQAVAHTLQDRPAVTDLTTARNRRRAAPRILVAAAVLALIASIGGVLVERQQVQDAQSQTTAIANVLSAPDVKIHQVTVHGARVRVMTSKSLDQALVAADGLPALPPGRQYQMWQITDAGKAISLGLMSHQSAGSSSARVLTGVNGAAEIAITVEPDGGSLQPTTAPVAAVRLA
ncbi:MAG: anti-sigma factor [Nocardioidaceae bacterium]